MFRQVKSNKDGKSFTDTALIPIQPETALLASEKRRALISQIAEHVSLPKHHFHDVYLKLITNYANFVQRLHILDQPKYDHLGGVLDAALKRSQLSLYQYKTYLTEHGIYPKTFSIQHELWNYVLMSSALCYGLGRNILHHRVHLYDAKRKDIGVWNPFSGPMEGEAKYYRPIDQLTHNEAYEKQATVLLARQLIPKAGFDWISSQVETMETWIALINSTKEEGEGSRGLFLNLILWCQDAIFSDDKPETFGARLERILTFVTPGDRKPSDTPEPGEQPEQTETPDEEKLTEAQKLEKTKYADGRNQKIFGTLGVEFVAWLRQAIASGRISYNKLGASMHILRGNLAMLSPQLFDDFVRDKRLSNVTGAQVMNEVKQLPLSKTTPGGEYVHTAQIGQHGAHMTKGLVVDANPLAASQTLEQDPNLRLVGLAVEHTGWWNTLMRPGSPSAHPSPHPDSGLPGGK